MTKIICLANSYKLRERCVAGIDISTGKWIRPVYGQYADGRIPKQLSTINGREPNVLDILEVPLLNTSHGYECENSLISSGQWKFIKKASIDDLVPYCENQILYSQWQKSVPFSFIQTLQLQNRRTLQLIKPSRITLYKYEDTKKWEASFFITNNQQFKCKITDISLINKLNSGAKLSEECLFTMSFSQPYQRHLSEEETCWRLIASVIELSDIDSILFEMKRIGWTKEHGRSYLQTTYNKLTRRELTNVQTKEFLNYLKSLR
ncbi:hypothetical protein CAL7716_058640 [Calothrix sp. PCC 7716]|nr:hypothetical protein CAL7716_058640 [Calothrix sp. PCC 7716]